MLKATKAKRMANVRLPERGAKDEDERIEEESTLGSGIG